MLEREQQHRCSQANARGSLRQGGGQDQRRRHDGEQRIKVQLSEPGCVKAQLLGIHNLFDGFLIARGCILHGRTGELIKESEFHVHSLPWRRSAAFFFTPFPLGVARATGGRTENVFRHASPWLDFTKETALRRASCKTAGYLS